MNPKLRRILLVLLSLILVVSIVGVVRSLLEDKEGSDIYASAEALVGMPDLSAVTPRPAATLRPETTPKPESAAETPPEPEETSDLRPETEEENPYPWETAGTTQSGGDYSGYEQSYVDALLTMDFSALREVNSETLGWIVIPNTIISYPLMQGTDNSYYLSRTWDHTYNSGGSIFMDYRNSPDLSDFNTIIYGHRMNSGRMFGTLGQYQSQSYWAEHPSVYLVDDNGVHIYDIFAVQEVSVSSSTYDLGMSEDADRQLYLRSCADNSVVDTGIEPDCTDQILTLSTCTGRGHATRWIIQAVLRQEDTAEAAPEVQ